MALYPSIRIEGGLLGPDLIDQLRAGELPGQRPIDFATLAPESAVAGNAIASANRRGATASANPRVVDRGEARPKRNLTDDVAIAFADARSLWSIFQHRRERLRSGDPGTSMTRASWVEPFLGLLDYDLTYNRRAYDLGGVTFAISHRAGAPEDAPPVHIVGVGQELGRAPVTGRTRLAPHALLQAYLNRTEALWGLVSNGSTLRLLRNCNNIRRQAYAEFDLPGMLDEQRFEDFEALYRLLHRSRMPRSADDAADCLIERYYLHGVEQGGRVRDRLRDGVEQCIERLANGFLRHPANDNLRRRLASDVSRDAWAITERGLYRHLLVLVYRFLFILVAEDRGLIGASPLYRGHYSVGRLRELIDRPVADSDHDDLWQSLRVLWRVLAADQPEQALGNRPLAALLDLPVLNGDLFTPGPLDDVTIDNRDLIGAFDHLARYKEGNAPRRRVNYAALDVEELGSVYESLLDFQPAIELEAGSRPGFRLVSGSARKSTGSFYTPPDLVAELVSSALKPAIEARLQPCVTSAEQERAVLSLRVCDPACGSGHFLLAAARCLGRELARIRAGEDEPAPEQVRESIRDVVTHSIYGVDRNPLAVDLCRVALWIESHAADKPLTFLDHRIRCGDSLVGVFDLDVLAGGIPDGAFNPRFGENAEAARTLKTQNRAERRDGQYRLPWGSAVSVVSFTDVAREIDIIADNSAEAVRRKKVLFDRRHADPDRWREYQACNMWAAAFFQPLGQNESVITTAMLAEHLVGRSVDPRAVGTAEYLSADHRFFHWPLEFPEVFADGGFDVLIGNPPWVSYTGRQKASASAGLLRSLLNRFPCMTRWPSTHAAFLVLAVELLSRHGRAGLVLPRQVSEQAAYGAARAEVTSRARLTGPVVDVGENAFPAVSQSVGLFTLAAGAAEQRHSDAPWPLTSSGRTRVMSNSPTLRAENVDNPLPNFAELLVGRPCFSSKTFADSGVHTGNVSRKIVLSERQDNADEYAPVREGRDISAYVCGATRKWLWTEPLLAKKEYCRIKQVQYYRRVPILLRQTANRPIAARHRNSTYFRNSLLACAGVPGMQDTVVVAFLNSALYALLHRAASQDANQRAFPQVKLRHLRSLPGVPANALDRNFEGSTVKDVLDEAVLIMEATAQSGERNVGEVLERIERAVLFAFDLDPVLAPRLLEAVK